jgi:glycosyltransferase involved in cell wall biosynthesis
MQADLLRGQGGPLPLGEALLPSWRARATEGRLLSVMRVALVHDWLVGRRGGEAVLEALVRLFPNAEIFTLLHRPGSVGGLIETRPIHVSPLQHVPGISRHYRNFLPLMPWAVRQLDVRGFDLVLSTSHCVAKGVRVPAGTPHLAYVFAPMRYMWDLFEEYFGPGRASWPVRLGARALRPSLQAWDRATASAPDVMLADSQHVARRIARAWGRTVEVVYPPVDVERFASGALGTGAGGYYLWVGALAPYKRLDVALEAFRRLGAPLWVAGAGQDAVRLRTALPSNVRWLGAVGDAELPALYRNARALVFPGEEDFGIVPLEAMASGRPVLALGRGGALETVTAETGLFFDAATAEALVEAVHRFESLETGFRPEAARARALAFGPAQFAAGIHRALEPLLGRASVVEGAV